MTLFAQDRPRQFKVWGRKAPAKLGGFSGHAHKYGYESIKIPSGFKRKAPRSNFREPEVSEQFARIGYLPFTYNSMRYVYAETRPYQEEIGQPIRALATPGEYVSLAFSIRSLQELRCVELELSPYADSQGKVLIPLNHLDLRIVRDLPVPTTEANEYVVRPKYLESFDEFDILNIPAGRSERFWLTVKIPEEAPAGVVRGKINIKCRVGGEYAWDTMIRILPFKLAVPDPEKDINFNILSNSNDPRGGSYGRDCNPGELQRILVDMVEHGMVSNSYEHVNPHVAKTEDGKLVFDFDRPGMTCIYSMNDFMYQVAKAGMNGPFCSYNGPYEWSQYMVPSLLKIPIYTPEYEDALRQIVTAVENQRKAMNWPEFIYFVGDEPGSHAGRLRLNMTCGRIIKEVNPQARVSNFFNGEWGGTKDWKLLKEVSDINCANFFNENTFKEGKEIGYQSFWGYNGVFRYEDDTRGERVFYGFHPWRCDLKGVTQYVYRSFPGALEHEGSLAYNPFAWSSSSYDYTYPSAEGPLPTQKWESLRQGIYDYRYLLTLKKLMAKADAAKRAKAQAIIDEVMSHFHLDFQGPKAAGYLEHYSPESLDVYRWKITQAILELL
ncbi:MAG: hypothetical protein RBT25_04895 [Lentisphaeria bacterium]|nr:hypothetical protein [Lentisphaeria bacterium]